MKTVQTKPDCTLGFVKDSGPIQEINSVKEIFSKYPLIGKLSEITEEQARELVEKQHYVGDGIEPMYKMYYTKESGLLQPYHYIEQDDEIIMGGFSLAISSLKSAAEEVGIEEKDFGNYLVIKL